MTTPQHTPQRTPQRIRHELRRRQLSVVRTQKISAHMVRITLGGPELEGFSSPGFDDHIKVFFADNTMRDYTPGHFDAQALTLELDFALHDAGPATTWAAQAQVGQPVAIGGPRGSFIVPTDFDGHLLVGDDTALPAIARRLAELPAGAPTLVLVEVDGPQDERTFDTAAQCTVVWVHRQGRAHGSALLERLPALALPAGDIYAWVACEYSAAKALRAHLVDSRGVQKQWIKAASYWRQGSADSHEKIED
jgi:NADPH-dependent ferric siderophore reductase